MIDTKEIKEKLDAITLDEIRTMPINVVDELIELAIALDDLIKMSAKQQSLGFVIKEQHTDRTKTIQEKILELLENHPSGLTVTEMNMMLPHSAAAIRDQIKVLEYNSMVIKLGERKKSHWGKHSIVWGLPLEVSDE